MYWHCAVSDLEDAASELADCAGTSNYDDGCYSEYADIDSAYDYESGVSSVDSEYE
jgi:hypothetical protein